MARDFSGSSSNYLSVGDVSAIDITGTALTVSVWANPDSASGDRTLVCKDGGTASTIQWKIWRNNGAGVMEWDVGDATNYDAVAGGTFSANVWQNFVLRKNGTGAGALKGYRNGTEVATGTSNRSIANQGAGLEFGVRSAGSFGPYDGKLAEIGIWDVALTVDEIAALAAGVSPLLIRPANLKGYWPLWGAGSPEADLSGNANSATINGTVAAANHSPTGMYVADATAGFSSSSPASIQFLDVPFISSATTVFAPTLSGTGVATLTVPFIASTTALYAVRLVQPGRGVSIAFGDTMLEPYPTWTRIG